MKAFQNHARSIAIAVIASVFALSITACSPSSNEGAQPSEGPAVTSTQSTAAGPANATFAAYTGTIPATMIKNQCALDNISGQFGGSPAQLHTGASALFVGWAGNGKGQAANGFLLVLKGSQSYSVPLSMNVERPDVAKATSSDGMVNSGYQVNASLTGVAAGSYHIVIVDPANASNICDTERDIVVQ
ncbi:hypothetical protein [Rhodanobacter sp. BL-MT-08]